MTSLRKTVSSLNLLATFESAARHASFTVAAAELGVTQAAVSQQIKVLEREMNTALFVRAHRRVNLTPAGQALATTISTSFTQIAEMVETIRQPAIPDTVAIGITLAFNQFWLLPRLPEFRARHPHIKLRLIADDASTDLRRAGLDVAVRYGKPPFEDATSIASCQDHAFPVCSPALLANLGIAPDTADIVKLPLIASDIVNPTWMPWRSWAKTVGLGPALGKASDLSKLRFNHYSDTVQAAINGEGVTMGWQVLLSNQLREGILVRIGSPSVTPQERHHIVVPKGHRATATVQAFLDWIMERFAAEA